ncbi:hypothetical protein MJH12_12775 [bacterium]|nr:hypothetical protein [bacterium]
MFKKSKIHHILIVLFIHLNLSYAQRLEYRGVVDANFYGSSNVHQFEGSVQSKKFKIHRSKEGDLLAFQVNFNILEMSTANNKRDQNMYKMFHSNQFSQMIGNFQNFPLEKILQNVHQDTVLKVPFDLNIKGFDQKLEALISNISHNNHTLSFELNFEISLSKSKLKAPRAMFGLIRVADQVQVKTIFSLKESALSQIRQKLSQLQTK